VSDDLDVVGERWALLIVRELLLRGPCRFTDLKSGLPGIVSNLLSGRLKDLEEAGLITSDDAPPPVATVLYSLTPQGRALEPVLKSLGRRGLHLMVADQAGDAFQSPWLAYAVEWFTTDTQPAAPPTVIQLIAADAAAIVDIANGTVTACPWRAVIPDLTIEGPPRSVLGLITGMIDVKYADQKGLRFTGSRKALSRLSPSVRADDSA
jgi:DNA-binding HxlR family transcriptional regulator